MELVFFQLDFMKLCMSPEDDLLSIVYCRSQKKHFDCNYDDSRVISNQFEPNLTIQLNRVSFCHVYKIKINSGLQNFSLGVAKYVFPHGKHTDKMYILKAVHFQMR